MARKKTRGGGEAPKADLRKRISEIFAKSAEQSDGAPRDTLGALMARLEAADLDGDQARKIMKILLADWRASLAKVNALLDSVGKRPGAA